MTDDDDDGGWEEYKAKFNKVYKNAEEEEMRRKLYLKCKKRIDEKNKYYIALTTHQANYLRLTLMSVMDSMIECVNHEGRSYLMYSVFTRYLPGI